MLCYAARTGTKKNLEALKAAGWRIMISPGERRSPPPGFRYAIDNGAWTAFTQKTLWDWDAFAVLVDRHGAQADFIVVPDVVADAKRSWDLSREWLCRLRNYVRILFALQDGMSAEQVGSILSAHRNCGLFLGGSTEWKLREMYAFGKVAHAFGRYYHVARVNTQRRMRLAIEAGAHSIDGSSASRFACNVKPLDVASRQSSLLTPARQS
jgi:hypothetical protein